MLTVKTELMDEKEFALFLDDVKKYLSSFRDNLENWSTKLARLTKEQLRRAKESLKGFWPADGLDRLAAYGRGELPKHLAFARVSIPLSAWRRLPEETQKRLSNPDELIQVLRPRGVENVPVSRMNAVDLETVVSKTGKIMSPKEQIPFAARMSPRQLRADDDAKNAYEIVSVRPTSDTKIVLVDLKLFGAPADEMPLTIKVKKTTASVFWR